MMYSGDEEIIYTGRKIKIDTQIFEQIMEQCPKKKVVSLCEKMIKKCSFKSGADIQNLSHLAYWLYVHGEPQLSLKCISFTHDVVFEQNYNVWDFIHAMWGLEIRLLKEQNKLDEAQKIIEIINKHLLTPTKIDTPEGTKTREAKRRERFTYESVIRNEKIERDLQDNDIKRANEWRFIALLGMIGNTETGLYPNLNERKDEIEQKITEYITELTKIK